MWKKKYNRKGNYLPVGTDVVWHILDNNVLVNYVSYYNNVAIDYSLYARL